MTLKRALTAGLGLALAMSSVIATASTSQAAPSRPNYNARPDFKMPFSCGQRWQLTTYRQHSPEDKKLDMMRVGGATNGSSVLASAGGVVHEHFSPGGLEIDHGNGWFTVYLHMSARAAVGTRVAQGGWIGTASNVGTGVPHLHYEQLFDSNGDNDGETNEMVNPRIQGVTYALREGQTFPVVASTNSCDGGTSPTPPTQPTRYWVDTFATASGLNDPREKLYAGTNYVFCKIWGREVRVGGSFNHWWLKTDMDTGGRDYISAYYLTKWGNDQAKDNNGRDIPNC